MNNNRVLIASPFFPYPPNFGGVYDVFARIKELKSLDYTIDLVYTDKDKPTLENIQFLSKYVEDIYYLKRKNKLFNLLSIKPLQVMSRNNFYLTPLTHQYDLLIVEGDSCGEILMNPSLKAKNKVLRVHNNESVYFYNLFKSTSNIFEKLYYFSESIKFRKYSKKLYKTVDRLWFISSDEYTKNNKIEQKNKGLHLPSPVSIEKNKGKNDFESSNVLFVGALFMPNNLEAIVWYLKNVHKFIVRDFPKYKFIIVGSTGKYSEEYFKDKFKNYSRIETHFNVKSLDSFYNKASVFVNPMQHGAGVKIKSIHSMINGLPLVSSKIGSEGIGLKHGEHYLMGNTSDEFLNGVKKLLDDKDLRRKIATKGQSFLIDNNSKKIIKSELSKLLA